jgi:hypothetical protein
MGGGHRHSWVVHGVQKIWGGRVFTQHIIPPPKMVFRAQILSANRTPQRELNVGLRTISKKYSNELSQGHLGELQISVKVQGLSKLIFTEFSVNIHFESAPTRAFTENFLFCTLNYFIFCIIKGPYNTPWDSVYRGIYRFKILTAIFENSCLPVKNLSQGEVG